MRKFWKKKEIEQSQENGGELILPRKQKKKMSRKKKVLLVAAACFMGFLVFNVFVGANQKPIVVTAAAIRQDISQTLNTSGTVISDKVVNCFAPLSAKIGEIRIEKGETVKKGEAVLLYDESSLSDLKALTRLNLQASQGGYQDNVEKNQRQQSLYTEATVNLEVLQQQITDTQNHIDALKKKLEEKQAALAYEGTLLEISRIDWADQPDSAEYQNLLKLIQRNSYEQQNNKEVRQLKEEIEANTQLLNEYKEYEAEMKSQKGSSEGGRLSSGGREQVEANAKIEGIKLENTMEAIAANEKGITAEFNGVITKMEAVEGKTPQEGELLFCLESLEDVAVSLSVSKYDLEKLKVGQQARITIAGREYQGEVDRIEQMATKNANGAAIVGAYIRITNPDQELFLGVEAKVVVSTGEVKGAVTIPIEAVNTDVDGQFVYVVENGIVVRKAVKTGLTTDLEIEIIEGLEEGAQVITEMRTDILEGMEVNALPAA